MSGLRIVGTLFGAGAVAYLIHRAIKSKHDSTPSERGSGRGSVPTSPPPAPSSQVHPVPTGVAMWQPLVRQLIATDYPRVNEGAAMEWLAAESGGNPCAVGDPASIVNGEPQEIGLGQLYNPDNFTKRGLSPAAFRAYCAAAAPLAEKYRAAKAANDTRGAAAAARQMQTVTRPLTAAEMDAQVRWTLLDKVNEGIDAADRTIEKYHLPWAHGSRDYWTLVKVPHAYPPIVHQGMPAVVKKLGHPPATWAEFRKALGMDMSNAEKLAEAGDPKAKLHWLWMRALNMCERVGNAATGER